MTVFVRVRNGATWHWCSNCPQFPKNDVETVEALPRDARRCRTCLDLAKSGGCTPAQVTAAPQPGAGASQDYTPEFGTRTPSSAIATRAGSAAATAQRKFLTYEQRVMLEAELRATNWLPAEEAKIVKEDILIKHETIFATQGFFPKDIAELWLMVKHGII